MQLHPAASSAFFSVSGLAYTLGVGSTTGVTTGAGVSTTSSTVSSTGASTVSSTASSTSASSTCSSTTSSVTTSATFSTGSAATGTTTGACVTAVPAATTIGASLPYTTYSCLLFLLRDLLIDAKIIIVNVQKVTPRQTITTRLGDSL